MGNGDLGNLYGDAVMEDISSNDVTMCDQEMEENYILIDMLKGQKNYFKG